MRHEVFEELVELAVAAQAPLDHTRPDGVHVAEGDAGEGQVVIADVDRGGGAPRVVLGEDGVGLPQHGARGPQEDEHPEEARVPAAGPVDEGHALQRGGLGEPSQHPAGRARWLVKLAQSHTATLAHHT